MRKSLAGPAAAVALALGIGTAAPAVAADDPTPARQGASWLAGQLTHGVVHNGQFKFDDYGLTADTGLELAAVGGHPTAVHDVRTALAAHVSDYVSYPSGTGTHTSAGSLAKLLVLAQATGATPTSFGGHNLVGELSALVSTTAPTAGRIADHLGEGDTDPTTAGDQPDTDFANVLGQALAARGLGNAHAADAADVLAFLLKQQCPAGWFRINLTSDKASASQGCSPATDTADTDATSYAVIQLAALHTRSAAVDAAIAKARSWLRARQHSGGAWGGGAGTTAVNANSTGLAAWALGRSAASRKAAIWLRRHQARDAGTCRTPLTKDKGAVAYDDAARTDGRAHGIGTASRDQWRRATAQVLVALRDAPAASGRLRVTSVSRVKGHHAVRLSVHGTAPWSAVCAVRGSTHNQVYAGSGGGAHPVVKLAPGSPSGTIRLADSDGRTVRYVVRLVGAHRVSVHRKR